MTAKAEVERLNLGRDIVAVSTCWQLSEETNAIWTIAAAPGELTNHAPTADEPAYIGAHPALPCCR